MKKLKTKQVKRFLDKISFILLINLILSFMIVSTSNVYADNILDEQTLQMDNTPSDPDPVEKWLKTDENSQATPDPEPDVESDPDPIVESDPDPVVESDPDNDTPVSDSDGDIIHTQDVKNPEDKITTKNSEDTNPINSNVTMSEYEEVNINSTDSNEIKIINIKHDVGDLKEGETFCINVEKPEETSIKSVEFQTSKNLDNLKFELSKLDSKPTEINESPCDNGEIYVYLDIKILTNGSYCHGDEFNTIKFVFNVEKNWVNQNQININTIKMRRYHSEWQDLPTHFKSEDDEFYYFESETPGFSTFTVVGNKIIETSPAIIQEKGEIPIGMGILIITLISLSIVIILFKSRFIYRD